MRETCSGSNEEYKFVLPAAPINAALRRCAKNKSREEYDEAMALDVCECNSDTSVLRAEQIQSLVTRDHMNSRNT
jgi:hypothetical protein